MTTSSTQRLPATTEPSSFPSSAQDIPSAQRAAISRPAGHNMSNKSPTATPFVTSPLARVARLSDPDASEASHPSDFMDCDETVSVTSYSSSTLGRSQSGTSGRLSLTTPSLSGSSVASNSTSMTDVDPHFDYEVCGSSYDAEVREPSFDEDASTSEPGLLFRSTYCMGLPRGSEVLTENPSFLYGSSTLSPMSRQSQLPPTSAISPRSSPSSMQTRGAHLSPSSSIAARRATAALNRSMNGPDISGRQAALPVQRLNFGQTLGLGRGFSYSPSASPLASPRSELPPIPDNDELSAEAFSVPELSRGAANGLRLNLAPINIAKSAFGQPNLPQTPGGSLFWGARDGAAGGEPLSPFSPPTPLCNPRDLDALMDSTFPPLALTQSPLQHTQADDQSASTPPMQDSVSLLRRDGSAGSVKNNNALLTPPYSPMDATKSISAGNEESSAGVTPQHAAGARRASTNSPSIAPVSSSMSTKKRVKDNFLGLSLGSEGFSRPKMLKSKSSAKRTIEPGTTLASRTTAVRKSVDDIPAMPSSAPATKTTFDLAPGASHLPTRSFSPPIPADAPVFKKPKSAAMRPSMSLPVSAPVSARHLSTRTLHPSFAAQYTLSDELGSGGFGFVVAANRNIDQRPVAVKFIWKDKVPAHGWVKDPQLGVVPMEVFVLKTVRSRFVVEYIDLFDDDEFFYLVMELHGTPWKAPGSEAPVAPPVQGISVDVSKDLLSPDLLKLQRPAMPTRRQSCDLFECIEQHSRLTESQARWVFAQVVEAVYDLDNLGISHRDIKDENCVIDADFNVKLIDFGSAVVTDIRKPAPYFNRFFGTMTFASSEILQGKSYRAPHAEVWSLGVLLSILLSGECPFADAAAAMRGRISKPKGTAWTTETLELMLGCLTIDPDARATIKDVRNHPWVRKAWDERGAQERTYMA